MDYIARKPLESVALLGGAITISPDRIVNYITREQATDDVLAILEHSDYTVLDHELVTAWVEKYPGDGATAADEMNRFFAIGNYVEHKEYDL